MLRGKGLEQLHNTWPLLNITKIDCSHFSKKEECVTQLFKPTTEIKPWNCRTMGLWEQLFYLATAGVQEQHFNLLTVGLWDCGSSFLEMHVKLVF